MKKYLYLLLFIIFLTAEIYPQWILTNAPKNVRIYTFTYSGSNIFAGGDITNIVATGGTVFQSSNNGLDWEIIGIDEECPEIRAIVAHDTLILAGSFGGGVFRSTNNGSKWANVSNGLINTSVYTMALLPVEGENPYLFAGTIGGGIFLSTNYGANWIEANNGLTANEIYSLAVSSSNLFAGTNDGVFLSTDKGQNWAQAGLDNSYIMSLTAFNTNLFASVNGVKYSSDKGVNWKDTKNGLTDLPVWALTSSGPNIFALTNWGNIFLSTNNGENWTLVNEGIIDTLVLAIGINDNYIFASSSEKGVWRRPLSEMITDVEGTAELPKDFTLYQNYPNPFNPITTISFQIPSTNYITLKIFDVLGREVSTLVNEEKHAGTYEVTWSAENLPSSVYFYQLKVGIYIETKKMILLR